MRPKLETVARLAGVSISTASRALSGDARVSDETRSKVATAAQQIRYQPNESARALRRQENRILGLIVKNLRNATLATMVERAQEVAAAQGFTCIVGSSGGSLEREAAMLDYVARQRIEALVLIGTGSNAERVARLVEFGTVVVTLVRDVPGTLAQHLPGSDRAGMRQAIEHLAGNGHERIGFIGPDASFSRGRELLGGYVEGLADSGLRRDHELIRTGPFDPAFGHGAAVTLLALPAPPSAIVVGDIEAMAGVQLAMTKARLVPGRDISVICMEDAPHLEWASPAITVVDCHPANQAELAVRKALAGLGYGLVPDKEAQVRPQLLYRDSVRRHDP